jgi:hypothetical protein
VNRRRASKHVTIFDVEMECIGVNNWDNLVGADPLSSCDNATSERPFS